MAMVKIHLKSPEYAIGVLKAGQMTERILALFEAGHGDEAIAVQLTAEGFRSPLHAYVLTSTVKGIRLRQGRMILRRQSHPRHVAGCLTVPQLAQALDVPRHWLYDRIHNGTIQIQPDPATRLYLFPDHPVTLGQLRQLHDGLLNIVRFSKEHQDA